MRNIFCNDLPTDRRLTGDDVAGLRFLPMRNGYEYVQVDHVLERLRTEIAERDQWIAHLESLLAEHRIAVTSTPAISVELPPADVASSTEVR
ncbi:MAG: hypothetical protein QM650_11410 [Microlunatus sp.]